jgi:hypothetical protein
MDAGMNQCVLPVQYVIDYESLLHNALAESWTSMSLFLREHLPLTWKEVYARTSLHPTNIVDFQFRTFDYIFDAYSKLEMTGEVCYDQTIMDRVLAVFGTSACGSQRSPRAIRDWSPPGEQVFCTERDNGHFIAHCIGGGLDVNVFSQERRLNRGWSPQGKVYRQMESYCHQRPGTFCFSRPVYEDGSNVPRWLEFGVFKEDQTFLVEIFDN